MNPKLRDLVEDAEANQSSRQLALGWVRYEALRRVSVRQFANICERLSDKPFDAQVDELACQDVTRGGGK